MYAKAKVGANHDALKPDSLGRRAAAAAPKKAAFVARWAVKVTPTRDRERRLGVKSNQAQDEQHVSSRYAFRFSRRLVQGLDD